MKNDWKETSVSLHTVERTHLSGSFARKCIVWDPYAVRMHVTKLVVESSSVPNRPEVWFFRTI